jgi:hypothetical protein
MESDVADTTTQRLVEHPLLVDGVKFDLGVFALYYVDAEQHLRAAVYTRDVLIRAATAPYPEGALAKDSPGVLVPSIDKYTPFWELPSLSAYPTAKAALDATVGLDDIWPQVEAVVSSTLGALHSKAVPFRAMQVVRFDLMVDAARKVWLIEINQSPRIHVSRSESDKTWRATLADDIAAYVLQLADGQADPAEPWRVVQGQAELRQGATPLLARSLAESESESETESETESESESESTGSSTATTAKPASAVDAVEIIKANAAVASLLALVGLLH